MIRYTLDGTDPKGSSALTYTAAIATAGFTDARLTVRAYVSKPGLSDSGISRASFLKA